MAKEHSQQFLKRRRFLTFLPVLVIPFIVVLFWLLGGGKGTAALQPAVKTGLNTQLPDANLKAGSPIDKLSFYRAADADSVKRENLLRMDPNYKDTGSSLKLAQYHHSSSSFSESRIQSKLAQLQQQLEEPVIPRHYKESAIAIEPDPFQSMPLSANTRKMDPQMEAINGTLEKILDIQHPERVKEKSTLKRTNVFAVSTMPGDFDNTYVGLKDTSKKVAGFYGESNSSNTLSEPNAIKAVVQETQVLQNGSRIKLRLLVDVYVAGIRVLAGNFVYGIVSVEGERLSIHIPGILYENNLLPVSLSVYYMDGIAGIYVPGSINRDVAKQAADNSLQSIGIISMDQSLKGQATAAGISAAKSLLSKKVKQINITAKAGDKVLLKDDKDQNQ